MRAAELQTAIYGRLATDAALLAALSPGWGFPPIFSDVPEIEGENNSLFPYVSFGPDVQTPWDTKTSFGAEVSVQIDVWSRQAGFVQAKQIVALIYARLHFQPLTIAGATLVYARCTSATTSLDPDGHTRRGLMLFDIVSDNISYV